MNDEQTITETFVEVTEINTDDDCPLFPVMVDGSQVALFLNRHEAELYARGIRFGLDYGVPF